MEGRRVRAHGLQPERAFLRCRPGAPTRRPRRRRFLRCRPRIRHLPTPAIPMLANLPATANFDFLVASLFTTQP
jgi:hypothetical protein